MESNYKITKSGNYLTALFVLLPILNVYNAGISGLGIGDVLCVPLIIYGLFFCNKAQNCGIKNTLQALVLYYFYAIFISLVNLMINSYSISDVFTRLLVYLFYIVVIIVFTGKRVINADYAYKFYLHISLIVSGIVFIQVVMHNLFNENVYFLLPFLKYNQSTLADYNTYVAAYNKMYQYQFRPTAVFLEPSHLALYISPCVFCVLSKNNIQKKDFVYALLITGAVLFSTSGTGYLLVFTVWIAHLFRIIKKGRIPAWMLFAFVILVVTVVVFFYNSDYSPVLTRRLRSVGDGSESSINVRLLKGLYDFKTLSPLEQIFGIGCGTYDSYININNGAFGYEYMNSICEVMVSTGILGFLIFAIYFLSLSRYFKKANYKLMPCLLVLMYLSGSVSFSWNDCFPIILTVALTDQTISSMERYEKNENS
jgi:hypothetical protein